MWKEVPKNKKWFSIELWKLKKLLVTTTGGETYYFNFDKMKKEVRSIDKHEVQLVEMKILDEVERKKKRPSFKYGAVPCIWVGNMFGCAICVGFPEIGNSMYIGHSRGVWEPKDKLIPKRIKFDEKTKKELRFEELIEKGCFYLTRKDV